METNTAGITTTEARYIAGLPPTHRLAATIRRHIARMPNDAPAHVHAMARAIHIAIWDASNGVTA